MRTPLKKENVLQHFAYTWWAYLLAAVLILFSWSMIYNATEYVPPADKTLQITLVGNFVSQDVLDYYTEKAQEEFPEMEKITVDNIPLDFTGEGDYSGYTKLTVVISVGEGDVYLLNRDLLVGYSSMQAFMPLDDEVAEGGSLYGLFSDEDIEAGTFVADDTDGQAHVYGISAQHLYGFISQGADTRDLYIACTSFTKNEEYALKAIAWLSEQTQEERPAWLDSLESETGESAQESLPEIG